MEVRLGIFCSLHVLILNKKSPLRSPTSKLFGAIFSSTYIIRVVGEPNEAVPEVHDLVFEEVDPILLGLGLPVEAVDPRDVAKDGVRLSQLHVA